MFPKVGDTVPKGCLNNLGQMVASNIRAGFVSFRNSQSDFFLKVESGPNRSLGNSESELPVKKLL